VLVADDAGDHVGTVSARRRPRAGDHRRHRQLFNGHRRSRDGLDQPEVRNGSRPGLLGAPAVSPDRDLRRHQLVRPRPRRLQSGAAVTPPIVQLSLDLTSLDEALETAAIGVEAGVDWLEAGTPLLLAEGLRAVEGLHARFPRHPIVADLKTMDGGYLEAEMM